MFAWAKVEGTIARLAQMPALTATFGMLGNKAAN
jgi:hypothetical protein